MALAGHGSWSVDTETTTKCPSSLVTCSINTELTCTCVAMGIATCDLLQHHSTQLRYAGSMQCCWRFENMVSSQAGKNLPFGFSLTSLFCFSCGRLTMTPSTLKGLKLQCGLWLVALDAKRWHKG